MSLQAYATRQYDYLALQNTKSRGETRLGLALFSDTTAGKITTGVQKLAQRWLLEFFTAAGSMPGIPTRGNNFIKDAQSGGFRTQLDVTTSFAAADMLISRNLNAEETDDMPPDERFGSAVLQNVFAAPSLNVSASSGTTAVYLNMTVKITSRAGTNYEIILPVETLP